MRTSVKDGEGNDTGVRKWLGRDGSVPEGQAILRAQYEEVEQTINEMLNRDDDDDEDEEEVSDGNEEDYEDISVVASSVADESESGFNSLASARSPMADVSFPVSPMGEPTQEYLQSSMSGSITNNLTSVAEQLAAMPITVSVADTDKTPTSSTMPPNVDNEACVGDASLTAKSKSGLPLGAAPLAAGASSGVSIPAPQNVPVIAGMTARPGQPAVAPVSIDHLAELRGNGADDHPTPTQASVHGVASTGHSPGSSAIAIDGDNYLRGSLDSDSARPSPCGSPPGKHTVSSIDALAAHIASGGGLSLDAAKNT
jgi:hypothetical protein